MFESISSVRKTSIYSCNFATLLIILKPRDISWSIPVIDASAVSWKERAQDSGREIMKHKTMKSMMDGLLSKLMLLRRCRFFLWTFFSCWPFGSPTSSTLQIRGNITFRGPTTKTLIITFIITIILMPHKRIITFFRSSWTFHSWPFFWNNRFILGRCIRWCNWSR